MLIATISCEEEKAYRQVLTDIHASDTLYISILTKIGWKLKIFSDGAGRISFGSKPSESVPFPEGTFEFEQLKEKFKEKEQFQEKANLFSITITFFVAEQKAGQARYLKDLQLGHDLFEKAYHSAMDTKSPIYNKRRVKKRYRQKAPVPEKYLEEYGEVR